MRLAAPLGRPRWRWFWKIFMLSAFLWPDMGGKLLIDSFLKTGLFGQEGANLILVKKMMISSS
ncbi:hypothetical protein CR207_09805 [Chromobacterium violaceum]|nr:hypothetical protein CR207_09805 [Chromobacterium violaceum]